MRATTPAPAGRAAGARRPRIKDVAAAAGVSPQTVSNVINARGRFTDATRDRVEQAIADLGFRPNQYAKSLRTRRTTMIGFDLSGTQMSVRNPFTLSFLHALVHAAALRGYRVLTFTHDAPGADDLRESSVDALVDGFVLNDSTPADPRPRVLHERGIPFVVVGRTASDLPAAWVDVDNRAAMRAPVDHLVGRGFHRFAFLGYDTHDYWDVDRLVGTEEHLARHGLPLASTVLVDPAGAGVREAVVDLLSGDDRPDAVVTSSDSLAVVVAQLAPGLGLRMGTDLGLTGFDAGPLAGMTEPPLASVRIPVEEIAELSIERLVRRLEGEEARDGLLVDTELVTDPTRPGAGTSDG
ncbi:LacI family DNA-binding transcriptional regulator [Aquipuribacter nitratireducens]|uniref:LacI family DNA-binding transcriptional regulator n=1 Tax=Aquipuribacter nitratireducens TaxID=650104 RepID=A0ABW0GHY3_9MICO